MAVYRFSTLSNHQAISFDPDSDRLFFDLDSMSAAGVDAWQDVQGLHVTEMTSGREVVLTGMTRFEVTTGNITFADGSRLLYGDNSVASNDDQSNTLGGSSHDDHLHGWGGDDTLYGRAGGDWLEGGNQDDRLEGGTGDDRLFGGDDQDTLYGDAGADTMYGGAGNDVYGVENAGDQVIEFPGQGRDLVISSVNNYVLPDFAENLTLWGDAQVGTGNALDNILTGTSKSNTLIGGDGDDHLRGLGGDDWLLGAAGDDTMIGGPGNDNYFVEDGGDVIVEAADGGRDRVWTSMDYTLRGAVEDLVLTSGRDASGTGNGLDNMLWGSDYSNTLSGAGGDDTLNGGIDPDVLRGGAGADTFLFTEQPGQGNADRILDFLPGTDRIELLNAGRDPELPPNNLADYGPAGTLAADDPRFYAAPGADSGHDADDRLVYDTSSGQLFYDPDGSGPDAALLIFTLRGAPALAASDITVVDSVTF